jgi:predicted Zn-dependent protease
MRPPLRFRRLLLAHLLGLAAACLTLACASTPQTKPGERTVLLDEEDEKIPSRGGSAPPEPGPSTPGTGRPGSPVLSTGADDARVGRDAYQDVVAEMGLLGNPELDAYVTEIGERLLRGIPRRRFNYKFAVVDQVEPNAFALPGGYVFVSRGLLALANDEDELACVIGHEITHAAHRHAAAQQAAAQAQNPLSMPWIRAANMAAYSRDMERDADKGGQLLAAAAGYDPMGMSTFLERLGQFERLQVGPRGPSFFDTHPGSVERATVNSVRSSEIRRRRNPELGDTRLSLLRKIEGLPLGPRPEGGIFEGDVFLHPSLGFQMTFPDGWRMQNTNRAVGAMSPHRDAIVYLTADLPPGELEAVGTAFVQKETEGRARIRDSRPVKVGTLDAWRIEFEAPGGAGTLFAMSTFFHYRDATWRITGMSPAVVAHKNRGRFLATTRSFRPISREAAARVAATRLHVVQANGGETLATLGNRTGNDWTPLRTAVENGLDSNHRFSGGERVKIAVREG